MPLRGANQPEDGLQFRGSQKVPRFESVGIGDNEQFLDGEAALGPELSTRRDLCATDEAAEVGLGVAVPCQDGSEVLRAADGVFRCLHEAMLLGVRPSATIGVCY